VLLMKYSSVVKSVLSVITSTKQGICDSLELCEVDATSTCLTQCKRHYLNSGNPEVNCSCIRDIEMSRWTLPSNTGISRGPSMPLSSPDHKFIRPVLHNTMSEYNFYLRKKVPTPYASVRVDKGKK
jgi:hypothetical protein